MYHPVGIHIVSYSTIRSLSPSESKIAQNNEVCSTWPRPGLAKNIIHLSNLQNATRTNSPNVPILVAYHVAPKQRDAPVLYMLLRIFSASPKTCQIPNGKANLAATTIDWCCNCGVPFSGAVVCDLAPSTMLKPRHNGTCTLAAFYYLDLPLRLKALQWHPPFLLSNAFAAPESPTATPLCHGKVKVHDSFTCLSNFALQSPIDPIKFFSQLMYCDWCM